MRRPRLLVVDDEVDVVETNREFLEDAGYEVVTATSGPQAKRLLAESFFDLLLLDERIKGSSGTELFGDARELYPGIGAIFITGHADVPCVLRALRAGAFDLLEKKELSKDTVLRCVRRALSQSAVVRENRYVWHDSREKSDFPDIIGNSPALQKALAVVRSVIPTAAPVLIQGESGTGKELVARAIHFQGPRAAKPFIPVNAAAIPASLMEGTLFGHRKGAFTDAREDRPGLFESANGGTVFLDEVGEMSPDVQVRLLRVLQEKKIARVGDAKEFSVDVRIVAATNRDLRREVEEKRFREDLFYRLAVVMITLPPLRARVPDIAPLALHLIEKNRQELNKNMNGIDPDAISKLERYHWPGNIRELDNVIQRAIIVARSEKIEPADLLLETHGKGNSLADLAKLPFNEAQLVFERQYFSELLQQENDNVTRSAARARIDRTVLHAHLKKIGWTRDREQAAD